MPARRIDFLAAPHPRRLDPGHPRRGEIMGCHAEAVRSGRSSYRDPVTGLTVFTAAFLADRNYCCDSGCRHCPFVI